MNKSLRTILLGFGIAAVSGVSLAADQPAVGTPGSAAPAAAPATNVQTPTTRPAKKMIKRHKRTHHAKSAAKKASS